MTETAKTAIARYNANVRFSAEMDIADRNLLIGRARRAQHGRYVLVIPHATRAVPFTSFKVECYSTNRDGLEIFRGYLSSRSPRCYRRLYAAAVRRAPAL